MKIDEVAREVALRRWALPEGLHVPIAAVDEEAIRSHIGEVVGRVEGRRTTRALLVQIPGAPAIDDRLPIWDLPGAQMFFQALQVWVDISFNGYRRAYRGLRPDDDIDGWILSHAMNRRTAFE